jgi:micrococcal nuclease
MPMTRLLFAVLALGALAVPAAARAQTLATSCRVAHVTNGDSFNCEGGRQVRLLLVDAPAAGRFGNIARSALATLIPVGSDVALETDSIPLDSSGRTLAYVYLSDGRMINDLLVREGFAFFKPNRENRRYAARLRSSEEQARAEKRGVWSE